MDPRPELNHAKFDVLIRHGVSLPPNAASCGGVISDLQPICPGHEHPLHRRGSIDQHETIDYALRNVDQSIMVWLARLVVRLQHHHQPRQLDDR